MIKNARLHNTNLQSEPNCKSKVSSAVLMVVKKAIGKF